MIKPEWGTKRVCPKCSTRFYDLGNDSPVVCIECGNEWVPEPLLKSKQQQLPIAKEEKPAKDEADSSSDGEEVDDIDLDVEVEDDDDDDVLGDVSLDDEDNEDVSGVIDTKVTGDGDDEDS